MGLMCGLETLGLPLRNQSHPIGRVDKITKNPEYIHNHERSAGKIFLGMLDLSKMANVNFQIGTPPWRLKPCGFLCPETPLWHGQRDKPRLLLTTEVFIRTSQMLTLEQEIIVGTRKHQEQLREWDGPFPIMETSYGGYFRAQLIIGGK